MLENQNDSQHIRHLVGKYDTPLYLYDANTIVDRTGQLRSALPDSMELFYSLKANPSLAITQLLQAQGVGLEVCSEDELKTALQLDYIPTQIIYSGPAKSRAGIRLAIESGIAAIVCGSSSEFNRIVEIASTLKKQANVLIRVNPDSSQKGCGLTMGGVASHLGMEEFWAREDHRQLLRCQFVRVRGIHVYYGTRILSADVIIENTRLILALANEIQNEWQYEFDMIDIGGGFGIPYFEHESELNLIELEKGLDDICVAYLKKHPNTRLVAESGRFLVADAGQLIVRIEDLRRSHGQYFAITTGGLHCHNGQLGLFGLPQNHYPIRVVKRRENDASEEIKTYFITGCLCSPIDMIARNIKLPRLSVGDYLCIQKTGAYGLTMGSTFFLSKKMPCEVLRDEEGCYLIRERFYQEDLFSKQLLLRKKS